MPINLSRIGLGTVEIGLPYGIGVDTLPSDKEAERILKTAIDLGITYIDTARGYGVAEERIGKFGISRIPGITVGTKCAQFLEKGEDPRGTELERRIREEVGESLKALRVDYLSLLQLHGGNAEQIKRGELLDILRRLQTEGKIKYFGICTRGVNSPLAAIKLKSKNYANDSKHGLQAPTGSVPAPGFYSIQTAYSILDQRMSPHVLPSAKASGIKIINRSVLLKGALTPAVWKLPPALDPLKENSTKAAAIAKKAGMDLPTLAFRFVFSNSAITTALVGTIKPGHLRSAISAANAGHLPPDVLEKLYALAIKDPGQVDPSHWPTQ